MNGAPLNGAAELPAHEIQRLLLPDAPRLSVAAPEVRSFVRHVLMAFPDTGAGRHFLRQVLQRYPLTSASAEIDDAELQISLGFTYRGLERLHLPPPVLAQFKRRAPAFSAGAAQRAAEHLGDTGASAAERWDRAFRAISLHAVLTVDATERRSLLQLLRLLRRQARPYRVQLRLLAAERLGAPEGRQGNWVHFGYRDGLSRTVVEGWPGAADSHPSSRHAAGEFLLGHPNDHRFNPWLLPTEHEQVRAFFRNGGFCALRRVEQAVSAFEEWVAERADWLEHERGDFQKSLFTDGAPPAATWGDWVKAKVCGRWPTGEPLLPPLPSHPNDASKTAPVPTADVEADFSYDGDPAGEGCPFGAHTRRMNPRQLADGDLALDSGSAPALAPVHTRRRPLLRRGRSYGPVWEPGSSSDKVSRGLIGQFFCASLEDQFEHLLGHWAERPPLGVPDSGNAKDPLVGQHENPRSTFAVPVAGELPLTLLKLQSFVRTRGTAYAFYPSLPAMQLLLDNARFYDLPEAPLLP